MTMKHILPILTLALLGAAVPAFADYYYDYYKDPGKTDVVSESWVRDPWNTYESKTDTFSYNDFEVSRNSQWTRINNGAEATLLNVSNFYRINVTGNNVDLYLTDYVDNAQSDYNANALYHHISEYGYRKLEKVEIEDERTLYIAADAPVVNTLSVTSDGTPQVTYGKTNETSNLQTIDSVTNEGKTVKRYQYYLGRFNDGDIIEVYMKDTVNPDGVYSYSGINEIDSVTNAPVGADGGFGDGGYRLDPVQTDKMLNGYYFQDDQLTARGMGELAFGEGEDAERAREATSSLAMPLSTLAPSAENGVYFGIIAKVNGVIYNGNNGNGGGGNGGGTFGSPLPGGLSIALIAGLFGLGFWYIRRRKAHVA